ncbi:hypothetical protein [Lacipirellula limnantheis]|uniref:Uncharacterized protein n=1 Tax=Lacipirellula limnantheis TaxID=2528024 RepID=A0A517TRL2_9BACT|nr:hypothetical protein [Lacipirellula limnantheis]QDT71010.1 hypothetical protein I41_01650 [Lacipirellula limnantheis]
MNADDSLHSLDDLAGRVLDEQAPLETAAMAALSADERRRLVDLQWIDALLAHGSSAEAAAVERSVAAVLAGLAGAAKPREAVIRGERAARRRWLPAVSLSSLAAAALVTLAIGVWWQRGSQQAMAMVERSYQAALAPLDRTYDVTVERTGGSMRSLKSTLTVRGGDKFLFEQRGPLGGVYRLGTDGHGYWFIPPTGSIVRAETDAFLPAWMRRASTDLPTLQVSTLLARMRDYYQLQRLPDEALAPGSRELSHLRANWSAGRPLGWKPGRLPPEQVELWADPVSGVVEQLVLTLPTDERRRARRVTLRLAEEKNLDESAYRAETYAPDRESVMAPGA